MGDVIWLVEFYVPWCSACQNAVPVWKATAEALEKRGLRVEVGAVNCETQAAICREWFDVPAYPTIMLLNEKWGMQQIYHKTQAKQVDPIVEWT